MIKNMFSAARFTRYGRGGTASGILNASAAFGNVVAAYLFTKMAEIMPWRWVAISWVAFVLTATIIGLISMRKWTAFIKEKEE